MAERTPTAQEEIVERGREAKREHVARHGGDHPMSAAATAGEAEQIARSLGLGTYGSDESAAADGPGNGEGAAARRG